MSVGNIQANTKMLKKWCIENQIESRIYDMLEKSFQTYRTENVDEFAHHFPLYSNEKVTKYLYQVSLQVPFGNDKQVYIVTYTRIEYNTKYAGEYKVVFSLDGKVVDDKLTIK